MGKSPRAAREHERKQASVLLTVVGVVTLGAVVIASFVYEVSVPNIVYAILATVIVPPDLLIKYLRGRK